MSMKDLFYFSRGERNVLFVLLSLIVVAWIAIILTDQEKEEPSEAAPVVSQAESPSAAVADTLSRQPQLLTPPPAKPKAASAPRQAVAAKRSWPRLPQSKPQYTRHSDKVAPGTVIELNQADTTRLKQVPGIGSTFARRIVRYRELLGGYYTVEQLAEVYGIDEDRYNALAPWFRVDTTAIQPLLINQLPYKELLRHPYLNKSQVRQIDRMRRQKPLQSWVDLSLLEEFTDLDRQRLRPYVSFRATP